MQFTLSMHKADLLKFRLPLQKIPLKFNLPKTVCEARADFRNEEILCKHLVQVSKSEFGPQSRQAKTVQQKLSEIQSNRKKR